MVFSFPLETPVYKQIFAAAVAVAALIAMAGSPSARDALQQTAPVIQK